MDAVKIALTTYQNNRDQLENLRRTRTELLAERQRINDQLPVLAAQIDELRAKVRASRQALIDATQND